MPDKEFNPEEFEAAETNKTVAESFAASVKPVDELSPEDQERYRQMLGEGNTPSKESLAMVEDLVTMVAKSVNLTDKMREQFVRSLTANQPYTHTFRYKDDRLSISFKTLSVKEHDAISEAIAEYSKTEGFETMGHLKFLNYKYTVSCSLAGVTVKNDDDADTIYQYKSPLEEYDMDFIEKEEHTVKLNGSNQTKTVKHRVKDRDRIVMAYSERFNDMDSTLYNLILNAHSEFDKQVNALALEMYSENFTQEELVSSP
jgi:hypothetical protein